MFHLERTPITDIIVKKGMNSILTVRQSCLKDDLNDILYWRCLDSGIAPFRTPSCESVIGSRHDIRSSYNTQYVHCPATPATGPATIFSGPVGSSIFSSFLGYQLTIVI